MSNPYSVKKSKEPFTGMHKVLHNFGDWEFETRHMTRLEKSIYFDARTLYLKEGKPLTDDLPLLERLLMCHSDDEKQALAFVLSHKFIHDKKSKRYKHREWDLIIKNYRFFHRNDVTANDNDVTDDVTHDVTHDVTPNDRIKALRNRNKQMIEALKQHGISANSRMKSKDLQALCQKHGIVIGNDVTDDVTANDNDATHDVTKNEPKNHAITINQEPITINQEPNNISPLTPQGAGVDMAGTHKTAKKTTQKTNSSSDTNKTLNVAFDEFWDAYDKKVDPKKCKPLWERLSDKDRLDAMAYIPKYKQAQPEKQYRKNPQTFLNARSWESEIISQPMPQPQFGGDNDPLAVNRHWQTNESKVVGGFVIPPTPTNSNIQRW